MCGRFGMDVKVSPADVYKEDEEQVPRFLINFNNYTKVGSHVKVIIKCSVFLIAFNVSTGWFQLMVGQPVSLQTVVVPVGDPDLKVYICVLYVKKF